MNIRNSARVINATVLAAVIGCAIAIPCCRSTPHNVERISLARADLTSLSKLLDPVEDAAAIKVADDIGKGLAALQAELEAGNGSESIAGLIAQVQALAMVYAAPDDPKQREIRLILTALEIGLRHLQVKEAG